MRISPVRSSLLALALAATPLVTSRVAEANGRFPIADQLTVDPVNPSHLVLRTTYGILSSSDAGASFSWVCEGAVGYGGTQDPAMGILADGTVLAGVFEGLSVTHDRGCTWTFVGAPLTAEYTIDVSVHRDDPSRAVAITSTGMGGGFHVMLAETSDNGATWTQAGETITSDMIALTVDVAPSMPDRVYVSGLVGKAIAPAIERTEDRGKTWTRTFLEAAYAKDVPFLAGVDPSNPERVYLRLSGGTNDRLLVSDDGAKSWKEVFTSVDDLLGFALSPDGKRVAIGGPKDGILVADAADLVFQKVSPLYTRCLTWHATGLYACANEFTDGFTLGLSKDEGKTFTPLYHLADICPIECAEGAPAPAKCDPTWPATAATLGIPPEACGGVTPSSGASSGATSSGGSSSSGDDDAGCGCRLGSTVNEGAVAGAALAALFTLVGGVMRRMRRTRGGR